MIFFQILHAAYTPSCFEILTSQQLLTEPRSPLALRNPSAKWLSHPPALAAPRFAQILFEKLLMLPLSVTSSQIPFNFLNAAYTTPFLNLDAADARGGAGNAFIFALYSLYTSFICPLNFLYISLMLPSYSLYISLIFLHLALFPFVFPSQLLHSSFMCFLYPSVTPLHLPLYSLWAPFIFPSLSYIFPLHLPFVFSYIAFIIPVSFLYVPSTIP